MMPLALSDSQLRLVTEAAWPIPVDKRGAFLQRIAGHLQQLGYRRVQDVDVERAVSVSLRGLLHAPCPFWTLCRIDRPTSDRI
jgi:hypothetical protein